MLYTFLQFLENEPGMMAAIGAFGILPLLLLFWIIQKICSLVLSTALNEIVTKKLTVWVALSWFIGFISQILLFFSNIYVIHSFFIYLSMLIIIFIAVMLNDKIITLYDLVEKQKSAIKAEK